MVNRGKAWRELFIFKIFGVYVSLVHSYFNAEEIYGVTYGFEISSEPVLLKESPDLGNTLLLSSKHGQQYQCVLPQLENLEKKNEENQHITKDEVPQLLEPMKKKCLYNNKGWWTYEVCFGKGIYQYHKEGQEIVGDKITLGVFSNETDWSQEKIVIKEKPKPGRSNVVKRFHSQYYVNGSNCDLTGKARETQIKIYCDEGIADVVLRVDEPLSCSYVITVHTNKLCKHSLFRPNPAQKPHAITCSPALSEERYKIYIERIESRKRAKKEAEEAKYQAQKARAAKKIESEEDELMEQDEEELSTKKKRSKRSQVWPWENPGIESEDEVWIDGNIKQNEIGVHRLDITKGRKKNANGFQESEGITVMSQKMQRKRDPEDQRQKGETKGNPDEISEPEDGQEQTEQTEKTVETETIEGARNAKDGDGLATEQNNEQESKEATLEEDVNEKAIESGGTPNGAGEKTDKETSETKQGLEDEWKNKIEEAVQKLRSTVLKLGIKPEVLDQKFKEKLGSVAEKVSEKEPTESNAGTDNEKVDKLENKDTNVPRETDQPKQTKTKDAFTRTIEEMKILSEGMMKDLMDVALATQAKMEKQFDEERAQMKSAVEHIKTKMKEIEETAEKNGVKDGQLGETIGKIKDSIERFEKTNMELDEDMLSVKELNKEIFRSIEAKANTDTKSDLLQLSSKTTKLVKKILLRRFQLEQDLHHIKKMQSEISADEENSQSAADNTEFGAAKGGIDQVVDKLKAMIQDLDNTEVRSEASASSAAEDTVNGIEPDSSTAARVEDADSASKSGLFDQGDMKTGVKVKVSKIKKISIPEDDESELEETDLDEEEMEELNMDKRIRLATKKMEEMVKQELRDSGVVPSGKIRVKIVTSKDALESLDGKNDVRLLSDKEETQFRDMILGLLGGSPEAGKERKRQQDLENNYNLVWSDDELQTIPREDDDADGEVEVESF